MPASSPSKSRLVEMICFLLSERITQPRARWKLILSEYNRLQKKLLNSHTLLEGTNMMLYPTNETCLIRWYKKNSRIEEIRRLMQGLSPQNLPECSSTSLPLARELPLEPSSPPLHPHVFEEPVTPFQDSVSASPSSDQTKPGPSRIPPASASRTTKWRHKKAGEKARQKKQRKIYSCSTSRQPMSAPGHTQFRGQRYCPHAQGQIPREEWLAKKRLEAKSKALATEPGDSNA